MCVCMRDRRGRKTKVHKTSRKKKQSKKYDVDYIKSTERRCSHEVLGIFTFMFCVCVCVFCFVSVSVYCVWHQWK